nr:immunoglobulin light chain junction region [Macaca mulatta]MOX85009.1 immunoglobulin light chain junction region [Macaca mulatta]MOX85127.1 immunoglobulin light chain junction region [Macaca mulatta]MOX85130.1 immunoglobulin light chain junction region [Macaca mulatta]MOX85271.1 immunoglobulin light chain junction region [Macaca mulatta]
CQQYEDLPWTF